MTPGNDFDPARYDFRGLHPDLCIGTASDRYAGWIGQIYSAEKYRGRISRRVNKVGAGSFREEVLPVDSVTEYFEHFRVLELDFTFYSMLLDDDGRPTRSFHVLSEYNACMKPQDRVFLKVPQAICAQKVRRAAGLVPNDDYLDAEKFRTQFLQPAQDLLGEKIKGFVFEQEYQRAAGKIPAPRLAENLDAFFSAVPPDNRYHFELRTEGYLVEPVFEVFEKHGVGQVLSHWTWLPTLEKQFARAGRRFFNTGAQSLIRLMTPLGKRYEDAYAMAHPFDKIVEGMLQPRMIDETARLAMTGIARGIHMNVIVNNRSGGNAPTIARQIAMSFLDLLRSGKSGAPA
ncbi:DUF72 domain-containing protein [Syntrophobacter fumaroxidans]|uniref:DUF72 domain-containing protein n=1 Tax=Syntrophobacter fumaroxidans (strain DSM 10017 / MPOB) TaxID=335543 RepID=A0LQ36_SYNFM|nr:DUF72 domain-containing protein [Syntrophobacter fumaroxidans]ABK19538.1 protein of unknown function DUF72 [Syntrophobacter fumaroxidans MPOB]